MTSVVYHHQNPLEFSRKMLCVHILGGHTPEELVLMELHWK
jgi:hypothetical protein